MSRRNYKIPNPLKAADDVWKKAAGPTNMPRQPKDPPTPVSYLAGTKKRKLRKKSSIPENKI